MKIRTLEEVFLGMILWRKAQPKSPGPMKLSQWNLLRQRKSVSEGQSSPQLLSETKGPSTLVVGPSEAQTHVTQIDESESPGPTQHRQSEGESNA